MLVHFHGGIPVGRERRSVGRHAGLLECAQDAQIAPRQSNRHIDDLFEGEMAGGPR